MCAKLPPFLVRGGGGGGRWGSSGSGNLRDVFLQEIARDSRGEEWMDAHANGQLFRDFYRRFCGGKEFNAQRTERWLRKLDAWATRNPGVGCPSE